MPELHKLTLTQVLNCSTGKDLSLDAGLVLMQVTVVMPCFRLTIFSPCVCSMMYFLLHAHRGISLLATCECTGNLGFLVKSAPGLASNVEGCSRRPIIGGWAAKV